ncbi:MAG: hypothetical protein JO325_06760 [Solirubrobacterales bacterium]|nr:hypothetical protein [Solirubrobacterales bacterium]
MRRSRRTAAVALSALAAAGGLTACGGSSSTQTSAASQGTGTQQRISALTEFAACARAHGVPVPDPNSQGQISGAEQLRQRYINTPEGQVTLRACGGYLQRAAAQLTLTNTPQRRNVALRFARCMRAHGVPVPDPGPNGQINAPSINQPSPQVQQAMTACSSLRLDGRTLAQIATGS